MKKRNIRIVNKATEGTEENSKHTNIINSIPIRIVGEPSDKVTNTSNKGDNVRVEDVNDDERHQHDQSHICTNGCQICMDEYQVGDALRCLPCGHEFHKGCLDPWLLKSGSCPSCRCTIFEKKLSPDNENEDFETDVEIYR